MSDGQLKAVIEDAVCEELQRANNYTTRATVYLRVLKRITSLMLIPWSMIPEIKSMIHLEEDMIELLKSVWHSQSTNESDEEFEKLIARDYVKPTEMSKFINILVRREMKQSQPRMEKICEILGVDMFLGSDNKRYVEYLKYFPDDFKGVHVRAVRTLYKEYSVSSENIYNICLAAYGWKNVENVMELEMKNRYLLKVGNNIDKIIEWKKQQIDEQNTSDVSVKKRKQTIEKSAVKKPKKSVTVEEEIKDSHLSSVSSESEDNN